MLPSFLSRRQSHLDGSRGTGQGPDSIRCPAKAFKVFVKADDLNGTIDAFQTLLRVLDLTPGEWSLFDFANLTKDFLKWILNCYASFWWQSSIVFTYLTHSVTAILSCQDLRCIALKRLYKERLSSNLKRWTVAKKRCCLVLNLLYISWKDLCFIQPVANLINNLRS